MRLKLLHHLAEAIEHAADLMRRSMAGESVFSNNDERQAALALIKLFPAIESHLKSPPRAPRFDYGIPLIPKCPLCGEGPGAHWPQDCHKNPTPGKYTYPPIASV